ncbi:NAD(P)/FAD-dependent oxidoreductase [Wenzhouxiangella sp. AB-CW3]|uniref:flavin-containing monooxygenase n=1 Tax=Wenzhouxiangella sp. AB-CW3 TaxID=2771012 RepID=UPI00168AC265|nr:NAD(P)/FAD-dependent oxidoreductase [Wenzhouxiangella sp. AB-CW3]QOC23684.1 NAD(P)/FAD-dependent oxidoreductase [Wenzhouxiangella sp. AB-CW3]
MNQQRRDELDVAIIGAGFSGVGAAILLGRRGRENFRVFDKCGGVGGTWWVNRYPGCACDVPSHLYSFSFAPNPDWTRRFAPRVEIQAYLENLVRQHRLESRIELGTEIVRANWNEQERRWHLSDATGRVCRARILVPALGGLSRPHWPDIPGLGGFAGKVVHTQQWPEDLDLTHRRVAVIGTGASAVQLIPHVARQAKQLDIYQRTPNWIIPRPDRAIGPRRRALYRRLPWLQKLVRFGVWAISETRVPAFLWSNRLAAGHRLLADWHRRRQIDDPELARAMRPDYDIGCKRVLLASDFYPVLNQDHVELINRGISRIESDAIVDSDGRRRVIDALILATGFKATAPVPEGLIIGCNGQDLAADWQAGPEAYKGTTVSGFPNLFMLLGPNTALGHNSVIMMIESQLRYLGAALDEMDRHRSDRIEVKASAQAAWNAMLERRLAGSVWNAGGCSSWYLHPVTRRNATIWPGFTLGFRKRLARFDAEAYEQQGPL